MISPSVYCTNCGTANVLHAKFCFGCGQSLQGVLSASSTSYPTGLLEANHLLKQRYRIRSQAGDEGVIA